MTKEQHELLSKILEYVLDSEKQHFEESGQPDNHIYALASKAYEELQTRRAS